MGTALEEIEFIARSEHRTGVLDALAEGSCDRHDLRAATGASSPTISRILSDFEAREWVVRTGPEYELTPLGAFVAERFAGLREAIDTEHRLRDVWRWLPREMEGFTVELFADAVVSYPGPGYPYEPVERVTWLIENTTAMRGFGTTVFKSVNNDTVCEGIRTRGLEYEYIYSPDVLRATVAWNPERVFEAQTHDHCTILVHDALPDEDRCGLGIFDDRIGICCHDAKTGALKAIIDTDAPEAREWAVSVFERHRAEARPLTPAEVVDLFPAELLA